MTTKEYADLMNLKKSLITEMLEYMEDGDVDYTKSDVGEYNRILEEYFKSMSRAENRVTAMQCVKSTVMELNQLNEKAGEDLIETDQREDICEFIIMTGTLFGFNQEDEDVTEEWREW